MEITIEEAMLCITKEKSDRESKFLEALTALQKEYRCDLTVPHFSLVDGKVIPHIAAVAR